MANKGTPKKKNSKPLEDVLKEAFETIKTMGFKSERKELVKLAIQVLLIVRGGLHPKLFAAQEKFNPYPIFVKYIRASNAESLGALIDDVLHVMSPNFVTLQSLGVLTETIYQAEDSLQERTLALLQTETIPLVIMMKRIYQDAQGYDEADTDLSEGAEK